MDKKTENFRKMEAEKIGKIELAGNKRLICGDWAQPQLKIVRPHYFICFFIH